MKSRFIFFILLFPALLWGQHQTEYYANGRVKSKFRSGKKIDKKTYYYPNRKKKSIVLTDKDGTLISIKTWNYNGELTGNTNFLKERLKKGKKDLSFIQWNRKDSVALFYMKKDSLSAISGSSLDDGDTIYFHYCCLDSAGYEYDNSIERNQPLYLVVGTHYFIKSFMDAILLMKMNEKAYILIPPKYGYGDKPAGNVPPNTTLVYYVDILSFKEGPTKKVK